MPGDAHSLNRSRTLLFFLKSSLRIVFWLVDTDIAQCLALYFMAHLPRKNSCFLFFYLM